MLNSNVTSRITDITTDMNSGWPSRLRYYSYFETTIQRNFFTFIENNVPICVCIVYTQGTDNATGIPHKTSISFTIVCRPSSDMRYTRCYMFISDTIIYGKPNSNLDDFDWTHLIN